jgi:hypothetical protein
MKTEAFKSLRSCVMIVVGKGGLMMSAAKDFLYKIIDEIPENQLPEVINFVQFLKVKREKELLNQIQNSSMSSTDFWDNQVDDEVWNDV